MDDDSRVDNPEIDRDIRTDEAWKVNQKTVYDLFVQSLYSSFGKDRVHFDKTISDAQQFDNQRQALATLALQHAVENTKAINAQSLRHEAYAANILQNVDEQGYQVNELLRNQASRDAIAASIADAVLNALSKIPTAAKEKTPA